MTADIKKIYNLQSFFPSKHLAFKDVVKII